MTCAMRYKQDEKTLACDVLEPLAEGLLTRCLGITGIPYGSLKKYEKSAQQLKWSA